jgi:hypothetical protein
MFCTYQVHMHVGSVLVFRSFSNFTLFLSSSETLKLLWPFLIMLY